MTTEAADEGRANAPESRRRILVGSDGSRKSLEAVRWAITEAQVHGGTVRVIVSWDVPNSIFLTPTWQESDYADNARKVLADVFDGRRLLRTPRQVPHGGGTQLTGGNATERTQYRLALQFAGHGNKGGRGHV